MSIKDRRNAVLKSSISLNSIRDSVTSFGKGISQSISKANEIVKQTRKTNVFKKTLIGKDNEYFRKRRENIRRKDREDELEASSVKGATKAQGNVVSKSVKGLLGRVLNFFGIILLGWLLNTLPGILKSISNLIRRVQKLIKILTDFVDGVKDFFVGMGQGIAQIFASLPKFDFNQGKQDADKASKSLEGGITLARQDFEQSVRNFGMPAGLGLDPRNPEGLIELDPDKKGGKKQGDEAPPTDGADAPPQNVDVDEKEKEMKGANLVNVGGKDEGAEQAKLLDKKLKDAQDNDEAVKGLKSKVAQDKGETINDKNFEEEDKKEEDKNQKFIIDGLNARLDELVGGKAKKETAKGKTVDEGEMLEKGKETISKSVSPMKDLNPFKIAADLLNPFKNRNKDADSITPNTKNRSALKRNKRRNGNTVMIVEKAVQPPQMVSVGSGSNKTNLNMNVNKNNEEQIMKKMSTLALNK